MMKKLFVFSLSLVLFSYCGGVFAHTENNSTYLGQEACAPCEPVDEQISDTCEAVVCDSSDTFRPFKHKRNRQSLFDSIEVYGWLQAGVYVNSRGNTVTRTKGANYKGRTVTQIEPTSGNGNLFSTVHSTDFQVNQLWLGVKKDADGTHGLDWGFAAEGYFGPEAWIAQSWGDANFDYGWQSGDYYTAIPQLYAQLAYGDLSVKFGKFETILGFEALRAPDFFFFSHSYIFLLEPYSHSGVFFQYAPDGSKLSLGAAYTTGTDTSIENIYDDHGFIGTISYQLTDKLNLSYAVMYNRNGYGTYHDSFDTNRYNLSGRNVYLHTVAISYNISDKLNYSLQWNYNDIKVRADKSHTNSYGIANYLTYQFNGRWGIGFRAEWANLANLVEFYGYGTDISEYTLGVNWKPYSNISIRPEIRYDYSADKTGTKPFNNGKDRDQFSGGITGVVSF
ncbi:MAG: porin [Planctomycetaceae bacterium]|nr:porin [Planctomycetaceae bacterium]